VIDNDNRLLDDQTPQIPHAHDNMEPAIQQPTVPPQPPTTLESALTHNWFRESFLIAAVEADIRAAQHHMWREENDFIPQPLTDQQRIEHGRPGSPERSLAPQQHNADTEAQAESSPTTEHTTHMPAHSRSNEYARITYVASERLRPLMRSR
jgi:hypothetical protein